VTYSRPLPQLPAALANKVLEELGDVGSEDNQHGWPDAAAVPRFAHHCLVLVFGAK